jgi:hypothetical protein
VRKLLGRMDAFQLDYLRAVQAEGAPVGWVIEIWRMMAENGDEAAIRLFSP